jgi:phospholipase A2
MTHVELFHGIVADDRQADHLDMPATRPESKKKDTNKDQDAHPITLIYFPLIPNADYQDNFNPGTEPFCSTFNFEIKEDQVELLAGLGEKNFGKGLEDVRTVLKETWLRKKHARLERERQEKRNRKHHTPESPKSPPPKK